MPDVIARLNAALLGRYSVERELGEGGMATVYLAQDLKHERQVALKVLKPAVAAVVGAERFLAEIKTTANLQHPNILPLYDSGDADGFLYYVMPYVKGESLRQRLDREHQLPVDDAVRIALNMAEALDYAHRQGVVHRDIKPANVLMVEGKPAIADFGIALAVGEAGGARLTETGLSLGTPHYMSPEQATGDQNVGPPTDIYVAVVSIGVAAWALRMDGGSLPTAARRATSTSGSSVSPTVLGSVSRRTRGETMPHGGPRTARP
jgi:serine/threonine-protein kinase